VFTSAIFFIILFSLTNPIKMGEGTDGKRGLADLEKAKLKKDSIFAHSDDKEDRKDAAEASARYAMRIAAVKHVYWSWP
jgi:hypothetical protein